MAMISLKNVSKLYQQGARPALDGVNVEVQAGEFVFLVGSSGSGKTTFLRLLSREEEATGGEVNIAGADLRRLPQRLVPKYRRTIGFVFQDYKLLANKTVWENIAFALDVIGAKRSTIKSVIPQVLETVGLTGKEDRYPHELSGGEVQRVAIARAYANHPRILLADEPTGNLDPTTSVGIMEVLDAINRTGTTVLMATHNEEIVNSMRKRVIELHDGKVVRDEAVGSYDSSQFYSDADVESKARSAIEKSVGKTNSAIKELKKSSHSNSRNKSQLSTKTHSDHQNVHANEFDGVERLAHNVHRGKTGRYGQTFAPIEDTLTWGKGLPQDGDDRQKNKKQGGAQ